MGRVSGLTTISEQLRYKSVRSFLVEVAVVVLVLVISLLAAAAILSDVSGQGIEPPPNYVSVGLTGLLALSLFGRRRWPCTVLVVISVLLVAIRLLEVPEYESSGLGIYIALFAAGRYGAAFRRDMARVFAVLVLLGLLAYGLADGWNTYEEFGITQSTFILIAISQVLADVVLSIGTWLFGDFARKRNDRERELAARTLELEASREENARRAVMDERVRIAREIHDVVAHHVSVMGVQAGAARRAVKASPEKAETPLRAIEDSSREAVQELHRLLGFLRRVDDVDPDGLSPDALTPLPSLKRLPALRRQLADAGLAIRLTVSGEERALPPSVDLNAFRILQEALTNCLKYAGVDQADVDITYEPGQLVVAVRDRGRGPSSAASISVGSGAGLPGMAERVALLGGSLHHGARPGGGFEVVANLPFDGEVTAAPSTMPGLASTETQQGVGT